MLLNLQLRRLAYLIKTSAPSEVLHSGWNLNSITLLETDDRIRDFADSSRASL